MKTLVTDGERFIEPNACADELSLGKMENIKANNIFKKFFKNKNILITGHTGFKGSWLSLILLELGANISGIALEPRTPKDNFVLCELSSHMPSYICDIRNKIKIKQIMNEINPEIIFHLAAQPLVKQSYYDPAETYEVNINGVINVLEEVRENDSIRSCIVVTTDKCYENKETLEPYKENDKLGGYDAYSASKACAEIISNSYRLSFFNPENYESHGKCIASVRAGNVIGGGDWSPDRIIPDCVRAIENNKPILIRNPNSIRPWQYVLEPLFGYLQLCIQLHKNPKIFSGPYNFGPDHTTNFTVLEMVQLFLEQYGKGSYEIADEQHAFHESGLLSLDIKKATDLLGFKPIYNFNKTIEETVKWYKYYNEGNVDHFCKKQIQEYLNNIC